MNLKQPSPPRALISLVPMIDVMLIMLVFFMVTSTYLNLDMMPFTENADPSSTQNSGQKPDGSQTILIRLGHDGVAYIRGRPMDATELASYLQTRLSEAPLTSVVVLPSQRASTQSLVALMDTATRAGSTRLRIVRLEERQ